MNLSLKQGFIFTMGAENDEGMDGLDEGMVLLFSRSEKDKVTVPVLPVTSWTPPGMCHHLTIRAMPRL